MSEMSDKVLFDFMDNNNKEFFRELMVDICDTIIQDSEPKESEMDTIIKTFFKQIKEGGN
jgi:hypothetical protein